MTESDEPEDQGSVDWSQLEDQVKDSEERAETLHDAQIEQRAGEIKDVLKKVLPSEVMANLDKPLEGPSGPKIGADGQPLILNAHEAYALAKERSDLAAVMAQTGRRKTIVEQQQLELKLEQAAESGNEEEKQKLQAEKDKLQEKIDRIEFWAAVLTLHPINKEFIEGALPRYSHWGHRQGQPDFEGQVNLCMAVEDDFYEAVDYLRQWTPREITAQREAAKTDPDAPWWASEWVDDMEKRMEDTIIKMKKSQQFLNDVVYGRTHPDGKPATPPEQPGINTNPSEVYPHNEYVELLRNLPGLDPVLEIMNGRLKNLPKSGWIIQAKVRPGSTGSGITLTKYEEGGFEAEGHYGELEKGSTRVDIKLNPGKHGHYVVSYLNPDRANDGSRYDGLTTTAQQEIRQLSAGILKGDMRSVSGLQSTAHDALVWEDLDKTLNYYKMPAEIARITGSPEEAKEIIIQLGRAMGMSDQEAMTFVEMFEAKKSFSPLEAAREYGYPSGYQSGHYMEAGDDSEFVPEE